MRDLGHLGTSLREGLGGSILVNSEVILDPILDPYLRNLIKPWKRPSFGRGYGPEAKYD